MERTHKCLGLIMEKDLEEMIPMLKENIKLAKLILEKNPHDDSVKNLLQSQRKTLEEYKKRLGMG